MSNSGYASFWSTIYVVTPAIILYKAAGLFGAEFAVELLLIILLAGTGTLIGSMAYQRVKDASFGLKLAYFGALVLFSGSLYFLIDLGIKTFLGE